MIGRLAARVVEFKGGVVRADGLYVRVHGLGEYGVSFWREVASYECFEGGEQKFVVEESHRILPSYYRRKVYTTSDDE